MALTIYYPSDCEDSVPSYICDPCPVTEKGGVSAFAFIKGDYTFTDPTDFAEWETAIENGDVILIPNTRGSYDGGAAKYGAGFGRVKERLLGYDYVLNFMDENLKANSAFYDAIDQSNNWKGAFFTETLVWMIDQRLTVSVKDAVEEDIETDVIWNVEVKWFYKNKPRKLTAPVGLQGNCFLLEEAP